MSLRNTIIIGLTLGLLAVVLAVVRFQWVVRNSQDELYAAVVAVVFLGVGIWAGRKVWVESKAKSPLPSFEAGSGELPVGALSDREIEVLTHMAGGRTNKEIAEEMFVSVNTVKTHASNIFSKLGVGRRVQAIQRAVELGIITQEGEKRP